MINGFEQPLEDGENDLVDRARAFLRRGNRGESAPKAHQQRQPTQALLLTPGELDECFRAKGPVATYEHVQRKFCEVNKIALTDDSKEDAK